MIGKLKGKIDYFSEDYLILDVGGVGYQVFCSARSLQLLSIGDFCELYIDTHVREDHIHLYGFLSDIEKACFSTLQSVSGIGPRMALNILSHLSVEQIQMGVSTKNKELFRNVSGVGPKLAERMVLELKDKISIIPGLNAASIGSFSGKQSDVAEDSILALTSLGVNRAHAQNLVAGILAASPDISVDELIKQALKARSNPSS